MRQRTHITFALSSNPQQTRTPRAARCLGQSLGHSPGGGPEDLEVDPRSRYLTPPEMTSRRSSLGLPCGCESQKMYKRARCVFFGNGSQVTKGRIMDGSDEANKVNESRVAGHASLSLGGGGRRRGLEYSQSTANQTEGDRATNGAGGVRTVKVKACPPPSLCFPDGHTTEAAIDERNSHTRFFGFLGRNNNTGSC